MGRGGGEGRGIREVVRGQKVRVSVGPWTLNNTSPLDEEGLRTQNSYFAVSGWVDGCEGKEIGDRCQKHARDGTTVESELALLAAQPQATHTLGPPPHVPTAGVART